MKFKVTVDLNAALQQAKKLQAALRKNRPDLLNQLGVQLLSLSKQAYVQKARKQRGIDGITWKPVQRDTIENRVRSRAPAKRIVEERRRLSDELRSLNAGSGKRKRGETGKAATARVKAKRKALSAKLQAMVDTEFAKYEIGRDTGLQFSSASPGFTTNDGKGGNLLKINGNESVTVGYNRNYSQYFDAQRKLMPDKIPADWQAKLDALAKKWADKQIKGVLSDS